MSASEDRFVEGELGQTQFTDEQFREIGKSVHTQCEVAFESFTEEALSAAESILRHAVMAWANTLEPKPGVLRACAAFQLALVTATADAVDCNDRAWKKIKENMQ